MIRRLLEVVHARLVERFEPCPWDSPEHPCPHCAPVRASRSYLRSVR